MKININVYTKKKHKQTQNPNIKKNEAVESKSNIHDNKIVVDRPPTWTFISLLTRFIYFCVRVKIKGDGTWHDDIQWMDNVCTCAAVAG